VRPRADSGSQSRTIIALALKLTMAACTRPRQVLKVSGPWRGRFAARLRIGKLALRRDCTEMQLPPSKKTRALLAYLAVTARAHSRNRLCAMFWSVPDDPPRGIALEPDPAADAGRHAGLPRDHADRESVALNLEGIAVDILSLRGAARNGTDAMSVDALREAVQALEGDFLEGLDLPDCQEFHSWCTAEREETRRLRAQVLGALVARLADTPDEALRHAPRAQPARARR